MNIVLLGKPMSGKGSQAVRLSKTLKIPAISTGDILRKEIRKKSVLGKKAAAYMHTGALVPDALIFSVLRKLLPKKGFILDGFPRTLSQAQALEKIRGIDLVVDVYCSDAAVLRRMRARRVCLHCGAIYGLEIPPKRPGFCDRCGGRLSQRADDTPATVRTRLAVYRKETAPLIRFYQQRKKYVRVNGEASIPVVQKNILKKIETIK